MTLLSDFLSLTLRAGAPISFESNFTLLEENADVDGYGKHLTSSSQNVPLIAFGVAQPQYRWEHAHGPHAQENEYGGLFTSLCLFGFKYGPQLCRDAMHSLHSTSLTL